MARFEIKTDFSPGTQFRVAGLLKKNGAKFYSHLECVLYDNNHETSKVYAIPLSLFLLEPSDNSVKEELENKYRQYGIPYMNHKLDKSRFVWLCNMIRCFMSITIIDTVWGPMNVDPYKKRAYAVWTYDIETYEEDEPYDDSDNGTDNEEAYRSAYEDDPMASWNND